MREINYKPPSSSSVFRLGSGLLGGSGRASIVVFASWYIVDQGERAVVLRLGAIVGEAGPGAHFKLPWIDTVRKITVQNQNKRYQRARGLLARPAAGEPHGQRHVRGVGSERRLRAVRRSRGRHLAAHRSARDVGRENDLRPVRRRARDSGARRANIDIGDAITSAITGPITHHQRPGREHRLLGSLRAERRAAHARAGRDPAARAEPAHDRRSRREIARTRAEGEANAIRLRGEAEGAAIRARADALRANADLVQLQAVEKWDGKLPTTMVPSTALPFIDLQPPPTRNRVAPTWRFHRRRSGPRRASAIFASSAAMTGGRSRC